MSRKKVITKLVSMIVAGAYALSNTGASAIPGTAPGDEKAPKYPEMRVDEIWSTIERINRDNPTAAVRIQIAQVAGQSELVAAIVQAVSGCAGSAGDCVEEAIARLGGLTISNLVSLSELAAALEAVGIPPNTVAEALDAYSSDVANAVVAGTIPEDFAAATLAEEAAGSLYR